MRYQSFFALLVLAHFGCSSPSPTQKCNSLVSALCNKTFDCGAGSAFPSEPACETQLSNQIGCANWTLPQGCTYDWSQFDTCLSDILAESCSAVQSGQQPPSCAGATSLQPSCPNGSGDIYCSDSGGSGTNGSCVSTQSGCTDGNTYSVVCNSSGCVCQVNGMTTQLAMTTQCSSDAAVLDPLCGWHLHIFPQPPQDMTVVPDLLPPPDMTAGCTISGTFYLPGTLNPQNPCQICDPTIFSSDWSSNDNVTCGNGCGMCSGGLCGPVALTSITGSSAIAIALDANYAYFTEGGANGSVSKVPLNGGATTPLVQSLYQPGAVAVDTNYVYYTVLNSGSGVGTIQKVPLNGGTVTTLGSGGKFPFYIAIDSANVYWTDGPTGMVYKVPLSGGTVTTLASGQSTPAGIAVDATSVYFANTGDGSVMKVALGGGTPTQLASGLSMPTNLAMDATYLYLTTANEIWRVPLSGGTATALDPFSSPNSYAGLAIDGTNAYFVTEFPKGGLYALLLSGGRNATTVVQGQTNITPYAVAVNSTCVYFTANGNVERAPK